MSDRLTERQKLILSLIIHEYTRSAQPVGSGTLVNNYRLDFSPATVRNEMALLTDLGYLRQPHTSAGRVPSEEGYKFFVGRLLQETELPDATQHMITHQFYQSAPDPDQWMRLAAAVLARQSKAASLVTAPHPEKSLIKHIELISTYSRQVLMIIVMIGGEVQQRFISLNDPLNQETLTRIAQTLTSVLHGKDLAGVQAEQSLTDSMVQQFHHWVIQSMIEAGTSRTNEVYLDGLSNVLSEPEFVDNNEAMRALKVLEQRTHLNHLVNRSVAGSDVGGVQVLIGLEGEIDELSQFSIVLARYGLPGVVMGTLGVLGPMRMPYSRTISTVRFIANIMSDLVTESVNEGHLLN